MIRQFLTSLVTGLIEGLGFSIAVILCYYFDFFHFIHITIVR